MGFYPQCLPEIRNPPRARTLAFQLLPSKCCRRFATKRMGGCVSMWMEKIRYGVLEVQTDKGLCYLRPSLGERIRLLWTFRNFCLLPREVLNRRELTLVASLLERGKFQPNGDCRIGIIEWASPLQPVQSPSEQSCPAAPNAKPCLPATSPAGNARRRSRRRRGKKRSQGAPTSQVGITTPSPARAR